MPYHDIIIKRDPCITRVPRNHWRSQDFIIGGANLTGGTLPSESRRDQLTRVGFWCRCQKRKALASFNICYILSSCMESMDNITSILVLMQNIEPCFISPCFKL